MILCRQLDKSTSAYAGPASVHPFFSRTQFMATLNSRQTPSLNPTRSPEYRLVLACARCQSDTVVINDVLDQIEAKLNWPKLIKIARWHGVLPLVYRNLAAVAAHRVPKETLSELLQLYLANSLHNQTLTAAMQGLVDLFKTHHIPVIFFKGPVLAAVVYDSIHLRRFSDIDVLVHAANIPQVRQLLIDNQFQPKQLTSLAQTDDYLRSRTWDDSFIHQTHHTILDLHSQLMPDYFPVAFDLNKIWSDCQLYQVNQTELYSLHPEDLMLYLCAHGSKELWRNLIWVCDVAEVVTRFPNLPWLRLLDRAKALGMERMFLLGLALAHELLGTPWPMPLEQIGTRNRVVANLVKIFERRILVDLEPGIPSVERGFWLFHNPLHLPLRDRWRDRLPQYGLMLKFFLTPNDEDRQFLALPPILEPLYYLIRPIRIGFKWGTPKQRSH